MLNGGINSDVPRLKQLIVWSCVVLAEFSSDRVTKSDYLRKRRIRLEEYDGRCKTIFFSGSKANRSEWFVFIAAIG
jgi:hypothetical protein